MIPSGVEVYVASTPVDFRKGPVSLMGPGAGRWSRSVQWIALRVPFEESRQGEDRLVGRQRGLPVRQNA
jgi:hypothetical protein